MARSYNLDELRALIINLSFKEPLCQNDSDTGVLIDRDLAMMLYEITPLLLDVVEAKLRWSITGSVEDTERALELIKRFHRSDDAKT